MEDSWFLQGWSVCVCVQATGHGCSKCTDTSAVPAQKLRTAAATHPTRVYTASPPYTPIQTGLASVACL